MSDSGWDWFHLMLLAATIGILVGVVVGWILIERVWRERRRP